MVDFKKLRADWYAGLTPEERARVDARQAIEDSYEATALEIPAERQRFTSNDGGRSTQIAQSWESPVKMRIETRGEGKDSYEILSFKNGSTGYEDFRLDEDLVRVLTETGPDNPEWADRWAICGGSLRYDACIVSTSQVLEYIRDKRPHLMGNDVSNVPGV